MWIKEKPSVIIFEKMRKNRLNFFHILFEFIPPEGRFLFHTHFLFPLMFSVFCLSSVFCFLSVGPNLHTFSSVFLKRFFNFWKNFGKKIRYFFIKNFQFFVIFGFSKNSDKIFLSCHLCFFQNFLNFF